MIIEDYSGNDQHCRVLGCHRQPINVATCAKHYPTDGPGKRGQAALEMLREIMTGCIHDANGCALWGRHLDKAKALLKEKP